MVSKSAPKSKFDKEALWWLGVVYFSAISKVIRNMVSNQENYFKTDKEDLRRQLDFAK